MDVQVLRQERVAQVLVHAPLERRLARVPLGREGEVDLGGRTGRRVRNESTQGTLEFIGLGKNESSRRKLASIDFGKREHSMKTRGYPIWK